MVKREEFGKFCRIDNTIAALCRFGKSNSANQFFCRIDQIPSFSKWAGNAGFCRGKVNKNSCLQKGYMLARRRNPIPTLYWDNSSTHSPQKRCSQESIAQSTGLGCPIFGLFFNFLNFFLIGVCFLKKNVVVLFIKKKISQIRICRTWNLFLVYHHCSPEMRSPSIKNS
jgi:hypothetical protein